jgi:hypothetical protein
MSLRHSSPSPWLNVCEWMLPKLEAGSLIPFVYASDAMDGSGAAVRWKANTYYFILSGINDGRISFNH